MSDSDDLIRGQIVRLEGSLKNARERNSKDLNKKVDFKDYANMTLKLADVSNRMDEDRFDTRNTEPIKPNTPGQQPTDNKNVKPSRIEAEQEFYDEIDPDDGIQFPSMGRFSAALFPLVDERESQIDIREFNELTAPEDDTPNLVQNKYETNSSYIKDLSSDQSEDYDYDTPQQQSIDSCPIDQIYSRQFSEEYQTTNPSKQFRNRSRSRTFQEDTPRSGKSSRSYSQAEIVTTPQFEESLRFDDPMKTYPTRKTAIRDNYNAIQDTNLELYNDDDDVNDVSPQYDDDYELTNELSQMENDDSNFDLNKALSTLEEVDVIYSANRKRSTLDNINVHSVESNHSDSDSDYDNFINQHQDHVTPQEEMRAKSPYNHPQAINTSQHVQQPQHVVRPRSPYYHHPVSKSSLASYPNVERAMSPPHIAMRRKQGNPDQLKRTTLPPQSMASYEEYGPRTPGPYPNSKISITTPQPNLSFRPVKSARDTQYDTVFSNRRKSIPDYDPADEYQQVEQEDIYRQRVAKAYNRNASTDPRRYAAYPREDIVSPTSPQQEFVYDIKEPFETIINASEIMKSRQQTEYQHPHIHNSNYTPYNNQRRQPAPARNIYATPHLNVSTGVNRNHGYVPTNDTSPVQSLDSGIDSLFNDVGNRPGTAAAQTVYYQNEYNDFDGSPKDSLKDMEDIVHQLRKELKVLTTKVNRFETKGVDQPLSGPPPRIMSPTGQKESTYSPDPFRSSSVASSGSEGGRAKLDLRSPQVRSPIACISPVQPYQTNTRPKYSRPNNDYVEYNLPQRDNAHLQKPVSRAMPTDRVKSSVLYTQHSSPTVNRPSSVSRITSNTTQYWNSNSTRPSTIVIPSSSTTTTKPFNYTSVPRAQSSTGTFALPDPRTQTSRYKAAPSYPTPPIKRSVSPQPKTSARKTNPARPTYSSNSNRISDRYNLEGDTQIPSTRIPKPNQRNH